VNISRLAIAVTLSLLPATALASPAHALSRGAVVALTGTDHIWVADDEGTLHWAGDTRALADRFVDWGARQELSATEIASLPKGDPWLSAGLVKLGTPIYLAKWEATEASPQLLHIQAIEDVALFGITGSNYGTFVMEEDAWKARFGFEAASLKTAELPSATGSPGAKTNGPTPASTPPRAPVATPVIPPAPPTPSGQSFLNQDLTGRTFNNAVLVRANFTGARLNGVRLSNTDLTGAVMTNARMANTILAGTDLIDAYLVGADLSGATFTDVNFRRVILAGTNLSGAILQYADLNSVNLSGATLDGSYLYKANFSNATLVGASLKGIHASDVNFTGANLAGANLRDAKLTGAILSSANLSGADLTGADLRDAKFVGTNLDGVIGYVKP
jgi:uncharacterized protein YjbI with pentapeptide repeats